MAIYLKFTPDVPGDSVAEGFEKQIIAHSFQFGVGLGIGAATKGEREVTSPSVSEVVVTKELDIGSATLFEQTCMSKEYTSVEVNFVGNSGKETNVPYLKIMLHNTIVSGFSMSSGGDRPSESLSLNFTKIDYEYKARDAGANKADAAKSPIKMWNLITNTNK